jgi:carboxypeptidase D
MNGFPCTVNPDSNTTTLNPWSWNTNVNMLYVDQPSPAGFSFVVPVDGVVDLLSPSHDFIPVSSNGDLPETNLTMVKATLSGQGPEQTVTTSKQAARVMWDFAQVWFQEYVTSLFGRKSRL